MENFLNNNENPQNMLNKFFLEALLGGVTAVSGFIYSIQHGSHLLTAQSIYMSFLTAKPLFIQTFFLHAFEAVFFGLIGSAAAVIGKYYGTILKNKIINYGKHNKVDKK